MLFNTTRTRKHLQAGDLKTLFIEELGWDRLRTSLTVPVGGEDFTLSPVAEKRGVYIFQCAPNVVGRIPEYAVRRKIEKEVTKSAFQHVIIFTDAKKTTQVWQWVSREAGKALTTREQVYHTGQSGELLLQKLERISFDISEEEGLTLTGVEYKLKDAFNKEKVTKKFYDRFQKEHDAFLEFVKNIPDGDFQRWYASVMINRLMFLYFIQAKGFLDSDTAYLKNKLKAHKGTFYQGFLCPLFFQGFAQRTHSPEVTKKLGKVPYLNGGLFAKHQIENDLGYGHLIAIPDEAFTKLFAFFDDYNWHLDDRPLKDEKEINPDVLGYIFEKYINQKQMGAYYTKEDITEYIGKNTILPFLLDRAREDCQVAFEGAGGLWRLLREDADRYLYPAVKHGTELPLPAFISQGIEDVAARGEWNKPAPSEFGLPTEIWREVVARRQRHDEVRAKLQSGEVRDVADLITFNLDIRQFAQDCIEQGGSDFLLAVWNVLNGTKEGRLPMSVLDPTCGSGAFLFAALEILDPLYETCLDRMASFVSDADLLNRAKDHKGFRDILTGAAGHSDRRYFVLKSIIVNNLFGVDIMEEATEICKLRLFLTLAAQVEADPKKENFGIEPLPDIDFNIRVGNTLVGFATEAQTEKAVTSRLDFENAWPRIQSRAAAVAKQFEAFQKSQNDQDADPVFVAGMKKGLRDGLKPLRDELDQYLGQQYGKIGKESLAAWKKTAQPFHWFIEFYRVMKAGGFDVIVGNPPYVEITPKNIEYKLSTEYKTLACGNLHAVSTERASSLLSQDGYFSFIIPSASCCTPRMAALMKEITTRHNCVWISLYDERPGKLFSGVDQQLSIHIGHRDTSSKGYYITPMRHWSGGATKNAASEREALFDLTQYLPVYLDGLVAQVLPKIGDELERGLLEKLHCTEKTPLQHLTKSGGSSCIYYRGAGGRYWRLVKSFPSFFKSSDGRGISTTEFCLEVQAEAAPILVCLYSSSLFYWFWRIASNCRHLTDRELSGFPIATSLLSNEAAPALRELCVQYECRLKETAQRLIKNNSKGGITVQDEYYASSAKSIIDEIDRSLQTHYGLSDEELDFVINYDLKYRLGRDEADSGSEP